ncbi:MAG: nucleoside-diphosphate kinase [Acidobacteria bacterium]|nr:nucleoside-diphosphate kinase [Acidobacteriota bacterium]
MAKERTLSIIKPNAVGRKKVGAIIQMIEEAGFEIIAMRMVRLTKKEAEAFYYVHKGKDFYESLTDFMSSGRSVVMVLEREDAIRELRELMGATDPAKAEKGTIRAKFGENIERNAIHGSDSPETAAFEVSFFFPDIELLPSR